MHLTTIIISLIAYFSRRDHALYLARRVVSVFSMLSVMVGGIFIGRGNMYAVAGAALLLATAPFGR